MKKSFDPKNTVYLIDGSTYLYRAYFGMRPLHTSQGLPVQAVYSFIRMIGKLVKMFNPEMLALVWDSKGRTERKEIFEDYKAGRQDAPTDLFQQKEKIVEFADLIGLKQVARVGVEADDIIGSLAKDFAAQGFNVVIIASDKDLYQLLSDNIFIYDPFKDDIFDRTEFEANRGFPVERLPFYHALLGDSSDNIPGVKGIGKKTAEDLVKQFASLQELYENLDKVDKARTQKALLENKDNAFLSLELFLLRYHEFGFAGADLAFDNNNWGNAKPLFEELEFKLMVKEAEDSSPQKNKETTQPFFEEKGYDFKCVTKLEDLKAVCEELRAAKAFGLDTETDGLKPLECNMIGLSLCTEIGKSYYVPFGHKVEEEQLSFEDVFKELKPIFEDVSIKKYLHNVKFDKLVLHKSKIGLEGVALDTMVAAGLAAKDWQKIGLKALSERYFNEQMLTFDDIVKKNKLKDFSYAPLNLAAGYAASDAHQTLALAHKLKQDLSSKDLDLYNRMEEPLLDILFDMELEGVVVDKNILEDIDKKVTLELEKIEQEIRALVGHEKSSLNLNSPKQVEELLFMQLNLPTQKKSGKGTGFSTDSSVLEILAEVHPVPALILKYRELSKLKSTYTGIDALPAHINPYTGKIHTTYSQIKTATGRLSSSSPNLQNIPVDSFDIRSAFKPNEDCIFISADYSQIELRVLAYLSQDQTLLTAFERGDDIHTITTAKLFNVAKEDVTSAQRQIGKRINFSIMYGLTPFGLSKDLKISFKDAKLYIDKFFEQYPKVLEWMEKTVNFAKENGFVETLWGRRRYVPEINETNKTKFDLARRLVVNTPVQGTAADIMKIGMINLHKKLKAENLLEDTKIQLQIHDELLISVKKEKQKQVEAIIKTVLESVVLWNVPLTVSIRSGSNWQEVSK